MFPCLFPCLCLALCFYVLFVMPMFRYMLLCTPFVMPMLRSMLLCALCHAYAWIYVFLGPRILPMFGSTCLVAMPCAIVALLSLIYLFLKFWALLVGCRSRSRGLGLHPHTLAYIKRFGSFPYMHVYACLLLCFMSMFASLVLGFAMLSALHGLDLVWLHPTPVWLCLGVTTCGCILVMLVCSMHTLS